MFPTQDLEQDAVKHLQPGIGLVLTGLQACPQLGFERVQPLERCVDRIVHDKPQKA